MGLEIFAFINGTTTRSGILGRYGRGPNRSVWMSVNNVEPAILTIFAIIPAIWEGVC